MNGQFAQFIAANRPILLDGGLATELERLGADLDHRLWSGRLLADAPHLIRQAHLSFARAGARVLTTASYQLNFPDLHASHLAAALFGSSVALARESAQLVALEKGHEIVVAASLGPYGAGLGHGEEYNGDYGDAGPADLAKWHRPRINILADSNPDVFAFETIPRLDEALIIAEVMKSHPAQEFWLSFQLRDSEHLANGDLWKDTVAALESLPGLVAIGINCSGPHLIKGAINVAQSASSVPLLVYPNSGEKYCDGHWISSPDGWPNATELQGWLAMGIVGIGGCCRVGPNQIRDLDSLLSTWSLEDHQEE